MDNIFVLFSTFRAILVSSVLSDPQASREKRVTEVFLVPQDHTVPKETL